MRSKSIIAALAKLLVNSDIERSVNIINQHPEEASAAADAQGINGLINSLAHQNKFWDKLSITFQKDIDSQVRGSATWEALHKSEIIKVSQLLKQHNIEFLIFKGSALAYQIYEHPYTRNRCDTDIIFANATTAKAAQDLIIKTLGYFTKNAVDGSLQVYEKSVYKTDGFGFLHAFDIHWKISNNNIYGDSLTFEYLNNNAVTIDDIQSKTPCIEDALLIACFHRLTHIAEGTGNSLYWLYDIHLIFKQLSETQWQQVLTRATTFQLSHTLIDANIVIKLFFNHEIPEPYLMRLKRTATNENNIDLFTKSQLSKITANILALSSYNDRIKLIKQILFPSINYMKQKYNTNNLFSLAYLYIHRIILGLIKTIKQ